MDSRRKGTMESGGWLSQTRTESLAGRGRPDSVQSPPKNSLENLLELSLRNVGNSVLCSRRSGSFVSMPAAAFKLETLAFPAQCRRLGELSRRVERWRVPGIHGDDLPAASCQCQEGATISAPGFVRRLAQQWDGLHLLSKKHHQVRR
jgi:hypothetical protein